MKITKGELIFGMAGTAIGFVLGYVVTKKKLEGEKHDRLSALDISEPEKTADIDNEKQEENISSEDNIVSKKRYEDMLSDLLYDIEEDESSDEDSDVNYEDMEEPREDEDIAAVKKEPPVTKTKRPYLVDEETAEDMLLDDEYHSEDLYFFIGSDLLTNLYGDPVNEYDAIGNEPRKRGFMSEEPLEKEDPILDKEIWVVNERRRMIYHVYRREESVKDTDIFPYDEDDYE